MNTLYVFPMAAPFISIIIPVLNEADSVNPILEHLSLLELQGGLEVVVVDGSSKGTTLCAIKPDIRQKIQLKTTIAPKGRGSQMNRGATLTDGEILIFLHADTLISQKAITRLRWEMRQNKATVGGAFDLGIHSSKKGYRLIEFMANRRSRITKVPYGDQAIFLRKKYFLKIGGFSEMPLMEDVDIMRRIRKRNDKIAILPIKVQTSPRRWEKEGALFGTLRNWLLLSLFLLGVPPDRLARFYKF
jgi:rSAM/selenodomain-associated transferase 2